MNAEQLIHKLIKATVSRAFREVGACIFILIFFGSFFPHLTAGTTCFDGCLLLITSAAFIAAVTLKFTLSEKILQKHPTTDHEFWHRTFLSQARLLRLVPFWYLTPLCVGILLYSLPTSTAHSGNWMANLAFLAIVFVVLSWINRKAAIQIEEQARTLR